MPWPARHRQPPRGELLPPADQAAELRAAADAAIETGDLARASHMSFGLGATLEELGDRDAAESAYRQAVVFARQVDAADPELMLAAILFADRLPRAVEGVDCPGRRNGGEFDRT